VVQPPMCTWGAKGFAEVWLNPSNDWIYPHLEMAAERMTELARKFESPNDLERRALSQAARELLLAQASDWAFIIKTGTMVDYAVRRTKEHLLRFTRLYEQLKAGTTPEDWKKRPSKNRQKDKDARWTKKHGRSFFGYKNHVNADARHKLIRAYGVTDASVHDSQEFDDLLNKGNTSSEVYADSAYRSAETERKLKARGFRSHIHKRGRRNRPLTDAETEANYRKSKVRARIEHVFGAQENAPGGRLVRVIGFVRAKVKIGLHNLAYNIRRLVILERAAAA